MQFMIKFLKKPIGIISTILILGLAVGGYFYFGGEEKPIFDVVVAKRSNLIQEVSVTGRVKPAKSVELAFEKSGKVSAVYANVGKQVSAGQILLTLDTNDLQIKLNNQQLALEKAKLILAKREPKTNAEDDLKKAYEDGFNTISNAFLDLPTIILGLDNILNSWRHSPYLADQELRFLGDTTREYHDTVARAYYATDKNFDVLLKRYKTFTRNSSPEELELMLNDTYTLSKQFSDTIKDTHNLVDYVENKKDESQREPEIDRDQALLDTYTEEINTHLAELLKIKDTIKYSREGITDNAFDISSTRIDIQQAELDIQDTLSQINNRIIRSPISSTVTKQDAKVGEIVSANTPLVSLISASQFEIEANVPEADIAKVSVGNGALVTLDAYGRDVVFKAKVVAVDPAETIVDGVATYKATFQFAKNDERVKSGMTANIDVKSANRENVIAVPQRAIIRKNGDQFVRIADGEGFREVKVETGLRGSDGNIEIISGISEGDEVITFSEE